MDPCSIYILYIKSTVFISLFKGFRTVRERSLYSSSIYIFFSDLKPRGGRRYATKPATCFSKLVHIISYALSNCLTLKLSEYGGYIGHSSSHRRGSVKLFTN